MAEYIILAIIIILIILSFMYLVKGIKSIPLSEEIIVFDNNAILNKKLLLENNLEELEIDFLSQKLDDDEYKILKENILDSINSINSINKSADNQAGQVSPALIADGEKEKEIKKIICTNCKKELEIDSKFCKFCGNKISL